MSDETAPEYVFSVDDEGDYYWHEDIQDVIDILKEYDENCKTLYMGTVQRLTHGDLIDVKCDIIEMMQERAYEEVGENSDAYLEDIPEDKLVDLHRAISEWLDANVPHPNFYTVDDIVEITVELDADGKYVSHRDVFNGLRKSMQETV